MYTVLKNQEFPLSSIDSQFKWVKYDENLKAPRFDKLIEKYRGRRTFASKQLLQTEEPEQLLNKSPKSNPNFYMFAQSPMAAKKEKIKFFQGNGKIMKFCELQDAPTTIYQDKYHG